jgi:DNA polymerase III epsilon subunit-like protein
MTITRKHDEPAAVLDIEASGFGRGSYPIEIGWVRGDGQAGCTLVVPAAGWTHWDAQAEAVHGIARETLLKHGREVPVVAQSLNDALAGLTVYCDGWAHDYAWLARLFDEAELAPRFRLESVARLLTEPELAGLDAARRAAMQKLGTQRHRASNDARALQQAIAAVRRAAEAPTPPSATDAPPR